MERPVKEIVDCWKTGSPAWAFADFSSFFFCTAFTPSPFCSQIQAGRPPWTFSRFIQHAVHSPDDVVLARGISATLQERAIARAKGTRSNALGVRCTILARSVRGQCMREQCMRGYACEKRVCTQREQWSVHARTVRGCVRGKDCYNFLAPESAARGLFLNRISRKSRKGQRRRPPAPSGGSSRPVGCPLWLGATAPAGGSYPRLRRGHLAPCRTK